MVLITCKNSGQMFVTGINWHSGKTGLAEATGRKEFGIAKWKSHGDACAAGVFSFFGSAFHLSCLRAQLSRRLTASLSL